MLIKHLKRTSQVDFRSEVYNDTLNTLVEFIFEERSSDGTSAF